MAAATIRDHDTLQIRELDARLLLSTIDVHELRVSNDGRVLRIDAAVSSVDQRRAIDPSLRSLPDVHVLWHDPPRTRALPSASAPHMGRRLARMFGDTAERSRFVPALLERVASSGRRLRQLELLAARYPEAVRPNLTPTEQRYLQRLLDQHFAALNTDLTDLDARLTTLFGTSASRCMPLASAPADWATRVRMAQADLRHIDRLLQQVVTPDPRLGARAPGHPRPANYARCSARCGTL